jgi:hypothetical protein
MHFITPSEERNESSLSFRPSDGGKKGLKPFIHRPIANFAYLRDKISLSLGRGAVFFV